MSAKGAAQALDLATVLDSLQALSQDSNFSSDVRELLCQAAARCSSFETHPGSKENLIAEIGLCLDAASDMLECPPPQDAAPGAAESRQPGQDTLPEPHEEEAAPAKPLLMQLPEDTDAELMGEFITESNEAIDAAEASLLELETSPGDIEAINTVFRAFHTIKGTSAFLGLDFITRLGHLAENLLSRIRDKEIVCRGGYADLALRSVDILKELLQGVQDALGGQDVPLPASYRSLVALLEDPEAHGISDESSYAEPPPARLGDILVSQGKADREEVEAVAASKGDAPLGEALVKSSTAKVSDVAQALRSQKRGPESSLRVRTDKLDRLIDMVGELVIAHSMVAQDELMFDRTHFEMARKVTHAGKIVRELQDLCMSLRMVPMRAVFQKMARLVRDLSRKVGKQVEFSTEGEETEIDRNMVDVIGDPLVHMVRNAVDHGIEMPQDRQALGKPATGQVSLHAYHSGGNVIVELTDDGRGLDRERIAAKAVTSGLIESADGLSDREVFELIFAAGFSTVEEVTDVSGRGVGMDVVRRGIESLRGRVQISSTFGQGSTFTIVLPLTLAITDGMLVRTGAERFIIPTVNIFMNFRPTADSLSTLAGRGEMVLLRDELMPIYRLHRLFDIEGAVHEPTQGILVVVGDGNRRCALMVDELLGQQQVVAKSLGGSLGQIKGVSGAAILGDGKVGLILDTT
ncbi:MAG: chemotaxis protein CheA, partial [Acidobacteriota bacterium]